MKRKLKRKRNNKHAAYEVVLRFMSISDTKSNEQVEK